MKIKKKDVVTANLNYANNWAPRAASDSDSIFETKVATRINVHPDDEESYTYIEVSFDTALVWMIADKTPDADDLLNYLSTLVPIGVTAAATPDPMSIALNSQNVLSGAADVAANVITTKTKSFFAKFIVPGVSPRPEGWKLTASIQGSLLTTDTGPEEHACLPIMWAEMMALSSDRKSKYNVGLNSIVFVDQDLSVKCLQIDGPMVSSTRVRGFLSTNGRMFNRTVSATRIDEVRFRYSACTLPDVPGVSIPEPPEEQVSEENPEEGSEGSSAPGSTGGGGTHTASPGPSHH
jgi:hypothetical protein